jgi:MtN3 and saliva related transmembrane protein
METAIQAMGVVAAGLTSLSYLPQVRKARSPGSTDHRSLKMLIALAAGLILWIAYGLLKHDWVIVLANVVGAALALTLIAFKIREKPSGRNVGEKCRFGGRQIWRELGNVNVRANAARYAHSLMQPSS